MSTQETKNGLEIIRLLGLKPCKEFADRYDTSGGNKTALGLYRTIKAIIDHIDPTHDQKIAMYEAGAYAFDVPPVYSGAWGRDSWITYIDAHGQWFPKRL